MKITRYLLIGLLLLAVVASPLLAVAQEDDDDEVMEVDTSEWVEFTSEDEYYTLLLPPDWFAGPSEEPASIVISNSEAILETFDDDDVPAEPGQKVIAVLGLLPADLLVLLGIELAEDATAEDLIAGISTAFMAETDEEDDTELGETDVLELSDDVEVGVVEISSESGMYEGYFVAYQTPDGLVVIGLVAAYTGEFDEEFQATATAILANMEINITIEEIMEMMGS